MKLKQASQEDALIFKTYFFRELDKVGIKDNGVYQKHDKSFKFILSNKGEMSDFLKHFLNLDVESKMLEEQKTNFINEYFVKRESDIIYKIKDNNIYFLIEHQSTSDRNMPERILTYSLEIIRGMRKNQNEKAKFLVIPIVLYTGKREWKVATNYSSMQIIEEKYKDFIIRQEYKLIDVNKYKKSDLIRKNTKMSSMLLIEKCRTKEELIDTLMELIIHTESQDRIEWLEKIVEYILPDLLGEAKHEVLRILKGKERSHMSDEWFETIKRNEIKKENRLRREGEKKGEKIGEKRGEEKGKKEGRRESLLEIIKNMIRLNQDEKIIIKFTKAKKSDIEEAKRELEAQ